MNGNEENNHPSYITTMHSIGGPKAIMMAWDSELEFYEPWNTGPGMKNPDGAKQYAKEWAKAEGIEYRP